MVKQGLLAYGNMAGRHGGVVVGLGLDMLDLLVVFMGLLFKILIIIELTRVRQVEACQLRGSRLHGQRVLPGVESGQGRRITNKDLRKFPSEASGCCDGLSFDTFAYMKLKVMGTLLAWSLDHIDGKRLGMGTARPACVESTGWTGDRRRRRGSHAAWRQSRANSFTAGIEAYWTRLEAPGAAQAG